MIQAIGEQIPTKVRPTDSKSDGARCSTSRTNYSKHDANNQLSFSIVRSAAYGKWESIHRALGIQLKTTSHAKHTACQGCGGTDRFRVMPDYANTGRWICGGGVGNTQVEDGFELLGHVFGWTPQEQLKAVADYLGLSKMDNKERDKIRAIAEKQSAQMALDAKLKHEQARRDHNILDIIADYDDAIRSRMRDQKTVNGINGRVVLSPTEWEIYAFRNLIKLGIECYGELINKGVQDA
jgi:hypothetical protein